MRKDKQNQEEADQDTQAAIPDTELEEGEDAEPDGGKQGTVRQPRFAEEAARVRTEVDESNQQTELATTFFRSHCPAVPVYPHFSSPEEIAKQVASAFEEMPVTAELWAKSAGAVEVLDQNGPMNLDRETIRLATLKKALDVRSRNYHLLMDEVDRGENLAFWLAQATRRTRIMSSEALLCDTARVAAWANDEAFLALVQEHFFRLPPKLLYRDALADFLAPIDVRTFGHKVSSEERREQVILHPNPSAFVRVAVHEHVKQRNSVRSRNRHVFLDVFWSGAPQEHLGKESHPLIEQLTAPLRLVSLITQKNPTDPEAAAKPTVSPLYVNVEIERDTDWASIINALPTREANALRATLDGAGKADIGEANYKKLRRLLPKLRWLVLCQTLETARPRFLNAPHLYTPPTSYREILAGRQSLTYAHTYEGRELRAYGELAKSVLPLAKRPSR